MTLILLFILATKVDAQQANPDPSAKRAKVAMNEGQKKAKKKNNREQAAKRETEDRIETKPIYAKSYNANRKKVRRERASNPKPVVQDVKVDR